jgi:hypothetical protein
MYRGTLLMRNSLPLGAYSSICLGPYGGPRGRGDGVCHPGLMSEIPLSYQDGRHMHPHRARSSRLSDWLQGRHVSLGLVSLHVSGTEPPMHLLHPLIKFDAVVFHALFNQVAACLSLRLLSLSVFTSRSLSLLPSEKSTT